MKNTLISGKLYTILDKQRFLYHQCLQSDTLSKLKFDTSKPVLFLGISTEKKLGTNITNPYHITFYKFLVESKTISFIVYGNVGVSSTREMFLSSITRIN